MKCMIYYENKIALQKLHINLYKVVCELSMLEFEILTKLKKKKTYGVIEGVITRRVE